MLAEYEKRLAKRDICAVEATLQKKSLRVENIKFKANGVINPYFGLTCIVWVAPKTELFGKLLVYQRAVKKELEEAGLGDFFFFLKPNSFHMTICDIVASPKPILLEEARGNIGQIRNAFSGEINIEPVSCQVKGVGFSSTITALVRFTKEELRKVVNLEKMIKDSTQVDVRDFTGHISLAYCVSNPDKAIGRIKDILRSNMSATFGDLTFSQFDLTSFTDMNTYKPLLSINFEKNQIVEHEKNWIMPKGNL